MGTADNYTKARDKNPTLVADVCIPDPIDAESYYYEFAPKSLFRYCTN
jgi:hypothetical protein